MKPYLQLLLAAALLAGLAPAAGAEVQVVWERNTGREATGEFKFPHVPAPSRTDAATNAKFAVISGSGDPNGGDLDALHDGLLPQNEDQPDANFFFEQLAQGGRLLVDLGATTEVRRVQTYSWHRDGRGPQVYKLYASDGTAPGFTAKPARPANPAQAGWKLLADVDTRPQRGDFGGQYGVSVADSQGALGSYRYLLFEVWSTHERDRFGNTFFSEIDVEDGRVHPAAPAIPGTYEIEFDTSETPKLAGWVETRLRPVCEAWYPKIIQLLGGDGYRPPRRLTITFKKGMPGVANTLGTRIHCAEDWFQQNLEGEAIGAVVHELVHVVQQDARARRGSPAPSWLVEGLADYVRWFKYEPEANRPRPNPARAKYTDSYRTTGAFLNYVFETRAQTGVAKTFASAIRNRQYTPELWKVQTGRTVDELWADYLKTLAPRR